MTSVVSALLPLMVVVTTLGIKEQLIFPEINFDKVTRVRGMDIVVVTTAKSDAEGRALLLEMGMPFEKKAGGQ